MNQNKLRRTVLVGLLVLAAVFVLTRGDMGEMLDLVSDFLNTETSASTMAYPDALPTEEEEAGAVSTATVAYGEYYYDVENVVLYLDTYGELPENYITKSEAEELGWSGGSVERYQDGAAIGGDRFGNREGLLPAGTWVECDIDTEDRDSRGAKRLVFSLEEGLYYFTDDHYESFVEVVVDENGDIVWE